MADIDNAVIQTENSVFLLRMIFVCDLDNNMPRYWKLLPLGKDRSRRKGD